MRSGRPEAISSRWSTPSGAAASGGFAPAVWYGDADQAIANAATRERADLIAMSTHGRSGLDRLRFGSVAEGVVRRAPVPVLLVRGMAAWDRGGIDRILVPLDGSEASEEVLPIVSCLAGPFDFEVQLLHVVEATQSLPGARGRGDGCPRSGDRSRLPRARWPRLSRPAAFVWA